MSKIVKDQTQLKKREKRPPVIQPGDLRSNKGWIYLKDEHIPNFRQPYLQGLPESLVPLLLFYLMAGFSRDMR